MFRPRLLEQPYAFLPDVPHPDQNRYGKPVETVPEGDPLREQPLNINGNAAIGENPNRYKQHGFYFDADNCIACHACEAACAEKNGTPAHIAFRSVGYLEGGTWPSTTRLNISMACNHCDNPVCLKGCPTRAYTKFAEYGAVLQDPDICFGCGYCTWVCPYNAPQLDPLAGHVSKCNMCVDRLEVGLKPACAAACLGGALDFGIIETRPAGRAQLLTHIPGFPDPDITHPNIRFQQTNSLPRELTRPDSRPLTYVRDGKVHRPQPAKSTKKPGWGPLFTRENPLVLFTLASQLVVGAFLTLFLGPKLGLAAFDAHPALRAVFLFALVGVQTLALIVSTLHLGRPHRFYRAFNNLRWSPVSREVAGIAVFYNLLGLYVLLTAVPVLSSWLPAGVNTAAAEIAGWGTGIAGLAALWFMHRIYRIPARPFWNHWQVVTSFFGSMAALGPLVAGLIFAVAEIVSEAALSPLMGALALPIVLGLAAEAVGLLLHARDLRRRGGEGAAAQQEQATTFGKSYLARNLGLGGSLALVAALGTLQVDGVAGLALWGLAALAIIATAILGRMLFYALVIPTTMPGAFFWRNPAFEEHARKTGLAAMPQVGVAPCGH